MLHAKVDQDKDGKVSFTEIMTFSKSMDKLVVILELETIMEDVDTSRDGKLSLEEHLNGIYKQAEGDGDGEMEFLAQIQVLETAKFQAADVNQDQLLDHNEQLELFFPE